MYSYGSSARAGGKKGHGGREYRPPKPRKDHTATPPPLKECSCLLQFDLPEYETTSPRRQHRAFGGRDRLQSLEKELRSLYQVHLVVPGRNQTGPVAVVGASNRQAFPAAVWFLKSLLVNSDTLHIPGKIQRQVKDPNDITIEGNWIIPSTSNTSLRWVFRSDNWSILAFCLSPSTSGHGDGNISINQDLLQALNTCMDNAQFGGGLDGDHFVGMHANYPVAIASGTSQKLQVLEDEIKKAVESLL